MTRARARADDLSDLLEPAGADPLFGTTLMLLEQRMEELKERLGFEDDDLNLDLGPLGTLH